MTKSTRNSYALMFVALILIGWLKLATPFVGVLFSYFVLSKLDFGRKWLTVCVFVALVLAVSFGFGYVFKQAITTLPHVATTAIPIMIQSAKEHGMELPFTDWDSMKIFALDSVKGALPYLGNAARTATKQFVFFAIGIVVAISIFLNPAVDLERNGYAIKNNLYTVFTNEIAARFRVFYNSFATVIGAQLIISTINTGLTSIFILFAHMPHTSMIVVATFLCGLLPIVGNLISNSIIVGIGFTVSPKLGISALIFLIVLHKFEYFLNSSIIGDRIKNPVWLTLVGLIVGEKLMGVAGMILAPVILNYLKIEASHISAPETEENQRLNP